MAACTDSDSGEQTTLPGATARPGATGTTQDTSPPGSSVPQSEALELPSPQVAFPEDAGVVDVVEDYGARGDGETDDTEAIRRAIAENVGTSRTLYFPAGTYLVSDTLEWRDGSGQWQPWLTLQGQGRDDTVIRLQDGAEGFQDPEQPRAVIATGSGLFGDSSGGGSKDYEGLGEGNEAFRNFVFDLTVDTGSKNPGAVGIDFLANNNGGLENVTVRSGDGGGVVGVSMTRRWPGPALIKSVAIEGFDFGISTLHTEYGLTLEHVVLEGQSRAGLRNDGNVLSIRRLTSTNSVPAIQNVSEHGLVVLLDSMLGGGSGDADAIENEGHLFVRGLETNGYRAAIEGFDGNSVEEYATTELSSGSTASLGLPVEETPSVEWSSPETWASVSDPAFAGGADPTDDEDDTAAIQAALDSGKATIYFPSGGQPWEGRYLVSDTLSVPASVDRIIGMESFVAPGAEAFENEAEPRAVLEIGDGDTDHPLVVERFRFGGYQTGTDGVIWMEHAAPRTVVLKHVILGGSDHTGYWGREGAGRLFLEDYCCSNLRLEGTEGVWARQLNLERNKVMVENQATPLWVLGIKTERPATVIETSDGGQTELLGGLLYPAREVPSDTPAFTSVESEHSLVYAVSAYVSDENNYAIQAEEVVDGETDQLLAVEAQERSRGSVVFR